MSTRLRVAILSLAGLVCACSGKAKFEAKASVNDQSASASGDESWQGDEGGEEGEGTAAEPEVGRSVEGHTGSGVAMATFPGFRMFDDGTSRVFLEVSEDVPVAESRQPALLTYRFAGVVVPERVNQLQLPTTHFETPVSLIRVVQVEGAAELQIHLRQPSDPKTRLKRGSGGTVLSVDFPKLQEGVSFKQRPTMSQAAPEPDAEKEETD